MVRLISRQRGGLAALKLTKLFGIDDFPAAKDSGKVLIIIIYCYLIIIIIITITIIITTHFKNNCKLVFLSCLNYYHISQIRALSKKKFQNKVNFYCLTLINT